MAAVIFDLDGVLIDSEPLHALADAQLLMKFGIELPVNYFDRFVGVTNKAMWEEIKKDYNIPLTADKLMELQMPLKYKLLQEMNFEPVQGISDLLVALRDRKIPMAIASSSPRLFIERAMEKIGIEQFFTVWLSGEEVEHSKPEPDIFLKVAELLNVSPQKCIVIEDSESGTIAARKAGMICIGYRNINSGNQDLKMADIIVSKIEEIDIDKFFIDRL